MDIAITLLSVYVIWKLSAFIAAHPPTMQMFPKKKTAYIPSVSVPRETAKDRYEKKLKKLEELPFDDIEMQTLRDELRREYIEEASREL